MEIVNARCTFPSTVRKSIFLAGPTPRGKVVPSWRPEALRILEELGFDGTVLEPEDADGSFHDFGDPDVWRAQVEWEEAALKRADCIVFWIPRDMATMPALTTNTEWGMWCDSGKVVLGTPPGAPSVKYQEHYARKFRVPLAHTLEDTLRLAVSMLGDGAPREGGECEVPLVLWRASSFQSWLRAQKAAGNRLDGCDLLWSFRVGPERKFTFAWTAHVNVFVASEGRNKTNEFVFGRTDVSAVVMYRRRDTLDDTEVVIVKEFRSPGRTPDGFVRELPCGSSKDTEEGTLQVAVHEVEEEAGVRLDPTRLRRIGARQLAATLSVHQAAVYAVELTEDELAGVKRDVGVVRGVEGDSERTYAHVFTVGELLARPLTDWSTLGMTLAALL